MRKNLLLAAMLGVVVAVVAGVVINAGILPSNNAEDAVAAPPSARGKKTKTPVPAATSTNTPVIAPTNTPAPATATRTNTPVLVPTNTPAPPTNTPAPGTPTSVPPTVTNTPGAGDPVVLAAGDISSCGNDGDEKTAQLLDVLAGTVITLGDNVYDNGTSTEFNNCYDPTWGRHTARTKPSPGNHEYNTSGATGYYGYFGAAAGDPAKGYYSYDLGAWHVVVVNSNCSAIGGCGAGSAQEQWLRADLAAHPAACTLAYWHHPRFSSGSSHGNTSGMQPIWQALYDFDADVVLSGHEHNYERFAPQTPGGAADPTSGIVEIVVGTGGRSHYGFGSPKPNSVVRNGDTYGVLKLTLHAASYDFQFVPEAGKTFTDTGSASCH